MCFPSATSPSLPTLTLATWRGWSKRSSPPHRTSASPLGPGHIALLTEFEKRSRSWFFFGVAGVPSESNLEITVRDLNPLNQLFSLGMQPVWRVGEEGVWSRVGRTDHVMREEIFSITFNVTAPPVKKALLFALTTPYTYTHLQSQLHTLEAQHGSNEGKFCREMAAKSLEARRLDLLTISQSPSLIPIPPP